MMMMMMMMISQSHRLMRQWNNLRILRLHFNQSIITNIHKLTVRNQRTTLRQCVGTAFRLLIVPLPGLLLIECKLQNIKISKYSNFKKVRERVNESVLGIVESVKLYLRIKIPTKIITDSQSKSDRYSNHQKYTKSGRKTKSKHLTVCHWQRIITQIGGRLTRKRIDKGTGFRVILGAMHNAFECSTTFWRVDIGKAIDSKEVNGLRKTIEIIPDVDKRTGIPNGFLRWNMNSYSGTCPGITWNAVV